MANNNKTGALNSITTLSAKLKSDKGIKSIYLWPLSIQIIINLLIFIIISLLIYNYVTSKEKIHINEKIELERQQINSYKFKLSQIQNLPLYIQQISELDRIESSIRYVVPNSPNLGQLELLLNQLSQNNNISLNKFQPENVQAYNPHISEQLVRIEATANYFNLVNYLVNIAQIYRIIQIKNINISRQNDNSMLANIELAVFFSN